MSLPLISSVLAFLVGTGLGILLQRYVLSRRTHVAQLEKEVDELKGEQLHLKDSLEQHFHQTAHLTQDLTNSYKALYEHLAGGAAQFTEKPLADLKHVLETSQASVAVEAPKDFAQSDSTDDEEALLKAYPEDVK